MNEGIILGLLGVGALLTGLVGSLYAFYSKEKMEAPGTFVIAMVFFAVFATVYIVNFKLLSNIWTIR